MKKVVWIVQKLDLHDPINSFIQGWLEQASREAPLMVIANEVGAHRLPANIEVFSLGKEKGKGRIGKTFELWKILWRNRRDISAILAHQCPIYLLAALPVTLITRIPLFLWFAHPVVSRTAKIASLFVKTIFTSVPQAYNSPCKKRFVVGQGIVFSRWPLIENTISQNNLHFLSLGRIQPSKNHRKMFEIIALLKENNIQVSLDLMGPEMDPLYKEELVRLIEEKKLSNEIQFLGPKPIEELSQLFSAYDLVFNFGVRAIDKSLLQPIACGLFPICEHEEIMSHYKDVISHYQKGSTNPESLAGLIMEVAKLNEEGQRLLKEGFRSYVEREHNLEVLMQRIYKRISQVVS